MKNALLTGILTLAATAPLARAGAPAPTAPGGSHWTGAGHTYDLAGAQTSSYTLDIQIAAGDAGAETVTVRISGDGRDETLVCSQQTTGQGWKKTCSDGGKGGGSLFDYGLGQDYYVAADGTAYSTQIVLDGADRMRFQRVALRNGQAVRFYAETLTKAAP